MKSLLASVLLASGLYGVIWSTSPVPRIPSGDQPEIWVCRIDPQGKRRVKNHWHVAFPGGFTCHYRGKTVPYTLEEVKPSPAEIRLEGRF